MIPDPCSELAMKQGCNCHLPRHLPYTAIHISTKNGFEVSVDDEVPDCPLHGEVPAEPALWVKDHWELVKKK